MAEPVLMASTTSLASVQVASLAQTVRPGCLSVTKNHARMEALAKILWTATSDATAHMAGLGLTVSKLWTGAENLPVKTGLGANKRVPHSIATALLVGRANSATLGKYLVRLLQGCEGWCAPSCARTEDIAKIWDKMGTNASALKVTMAVTARVRSTSAIPTLARMGPRAKI